MNMASRMVNKGQVLDTSSQHDVALLNLGGVGGSQPRNSIQKMREYVGLEALALQGEVSTLQARGIPSRISINLKEATSCSFLGLAEQA